MTDDAARRRGGEDHAVRPRLARAQAADHQGPAIPQAHRRLHGRRHQRRPRAARRRRRDQRRHRRGHRQRVGGHDPAGKVPAGPGRGRASRGARSSPTSSSTSAWARAATSATCSACWGRASSCPSCRWRPIQILANNLLYDISQTAIPTDDVDPEQVEKPRPWDIEAADALHRLHRPVLVDLRLHDVLHDAVRLQLLERLDARGRGAQREPLSDRLVRGEPAHADAHHPRHPHQQDPVPAEPPVLAADGHVRLHHGDRHRHAVHAARDLPRLHGAAAALLAAAGADAAVLRRPDASGQDVARPPTSGSDRGGENRAPGSPDPGDSTPVDV